ncbi:MAG: TonB-dependent receptor plug domain-containing protein [Gemmatimonadetes bacterium]|nr:TonB-dependent receptor plug domain-containing protein [Gemmatimonadota bacterium]
MTEAAGGRPLDQAQVVIVGTTLGGLTNADGRFTFRAVTPGNVTVRVLRVGYSEQKKPVTVAAGQAASLEFALTEVALTLAPVVTTATGDQRRVELGNAVASIDAAKIAETSVVRDVNDMLNSRTAGVTVTGGTQTGSGARIRIRGQNSLSLSNDPIFIIDGVRMSNNVGSSNLFTGGAQPSRIGDLNPEEIESMEIVKGPSAATLYGTDAANGVVLITTKRGRAGTARWTIYGEGGSSRTRTPIRPHTRSSGAARTREPPWRSMGAICRWCRRGSAPSTRSRSTTCSPIRTSRRWAPATATSTGCSCRAATTWCVTSCRASARTKPGCWSSRRSNVVAWTRSTCPFANGPSARTCWARTASVPTSTPR